jgi:hypothetical protein
MVTYPAPPPDEGATSLTAKPPLALSGWPESGPEPGETHAVAPAQDSASQTANPVDFIDAKTLPDPTDGVVCVTAM